MPLIRRLPKRGFNNARHKAYYLEVNLKDLNRFEDGSDVDESVLRQSGLANGRADGVKVLGKGELTKKLNLKVHAVSASARQKIEALGGKCELIEKKAPSSSTTEQ